MLFSFLRFFTIIILCGEVVKFSPKKAGSQEQCENYERRTKTISPTLLAVTVRTLREVLSPMFPPH